MKKITYVIMTCFLCFSALASGYLSKCAQTDDNPRGSCGSTCVGSCTITTNPNGACKFALLGFCQPSSGSPTVTGTVETGACRASGSSFCACDGLGPKVPTPVVAACF